MNLEEIKNKLDILDVVQRYIKLKRVGKYYTGLCPFHKETKPSFFVSQERQIFKCFGCNEGGDAIKFLMKIENLDFKQVLEKLKEEYGLDIETIKKDKTGEKEILNINYAALKFFRKNLKENKDVLNYLQERGLNRKTIDEFELGFSPGNTLLRDYLYSLGYSLEKIKKAGLLDEKNFDRFQSRIIFPLRNENGKLVGFTGRLFQKSLGPKYLNTPETLIFKKSQFLYGLFYAKEYILSQKKVFLVEGQFDFLLAYQNNLKNVVAISGSALTLEHLQKLKKYSQQIVLAFDNDQSGFYSSLRTNLLAKKLGFQTFKAIYQGKDFGEFFLNKNKEILEERFEDWLLDYLLKIYQEEKKEILPIFLPQLKNLKPIEIDEYLEKLSSSLNISKNLLEKELENTSDIYFPQEKEIVEEKTLEENLALKLISLVYLDKEKINVKELENILPFGFKEFLNRVLENNLSEGEREYLEMRKNFYLSSKFSLEKEFKKTYLSFRKIILKNNLKNLHQELKLAKNEEYEKIMKKINVILIELRNIEK